MLVSEVITQGINQTADKNYFIAFISSRLGIPSWFMAFYFLQWQNLYCFIECGLDLRCENIWKYNFDDLEIII